MAKVDNPYDYSRAVLAETAKARATGANPNTDEITQQYAAAQGDIAAKSEAAQSNLKFSEKQLAEIGRQFTAKLTEKDRQFISTLAEEGRQFTGTLGFNQEKFAAKMAQDQQMLDTWADQNKWATGIAIANLGTQILSVPLAWKTEAKLEATNQRLAGQQTELVNLRKAENVNMEARQTKADDEAAFQRTIPGRIAALPTVMPAVLPAQPTILPNYNLRDARAGRFFTPPLQ